MNIKETTEYVRGKILALGFDLVGFAKAVELEEEKKRLKIWLDRAYHGHMNWIEKSFDKRINPRKVLPEVKSIISIGLNYYQSHKATYFSERSGKISKYAWGKDYHKVFEKKFKSINKILLEVDADSKNKFYVDYGPTMDKVWAVRSGLGWMGKHTNIINTSIGSWFFIGTVLTSIEFEYDDPISDMCGKCRICIDACPTNAIVEDYIIDANKCISYHTIENKNQIPEIFKGKFKDYVFGCDICQEVCPWNLKLQTETNEDSFASNTIEYLEEQELKSLDEIGFRNKFQGRPILRTGLKNLLRNFEFINAKERRNV